MHNLWNLLSAFSFRLLAYMNEYLKNLNRIEVIETLACTGHCKHCSEGNHAGFTNHLDGTCAAKAIDEICRVYNIDSLMVFGGEPLLYPEDVCKIFKAGKKSEIRRRDLITNGYFSKDEAAIHDVAEKLADSEVNRILLSVDAFHQETIPLEPVMTFATCIQSTGIMTELSPAWLVSPDDNNSYNVKTREILKLFMDIGLDMGVGNVIWPEGNARIYLKEYFDLSKEYVNPYEDDPKDLRAVSIEADGKLLQGNIYQNSIIKILEDYRP